MATVAADPRVKCLLLPLQTGTLLVPNSVVAEIVPAQRYQTDGQPLRDWMLGTIEWRGMVLPLISIERLSRPGEGEFPVKVPFAVLHRLNEAASGLPYYAVYIDGIPHFNFVARDTLKMTGTGDDAYVAHRIELQGEPGLIPDLDAIEHALEQMELRPAER